MTQVANLMGSSKSLDEWTANCETVKEAFGGDYPEFWFRVILQSGLAERVLASLGSSARLKVTTFGLEEER